MNAIHLDCQGLPCPQPVLQCKHSLETQAPTQLAVLVDNEAALQNVTRFLGTQGLNVSHVQKEGSLWEITASRRNTSTSDTAVPKAASGTASEATPEAASTGSLQPAGADQDGKTLVFLSTQGIGSGDEQLGEKLMASFLATLPELGSQLWRMILVNGAVHLAVQGSPALDSLRELEDAGVSILVCGTCLTHFDLLHHKAVGQTTNMLDVVTSLQLADKVIRV
jgi:selenium metabolism protein YedF